MAEDPEKGLKWIGVTVVKPLLAIICIIFGFIVIAKPEFIAWIIGLFLIMEGILTMTDYLELGEHQD